MKKELQVCHFPVNILGSKNAMDDAAREGYSLLQSPMFQMRSASASSPRVSGLSLNNNSISSPRMSPIPEANQSNMLLFNSYPALCENFETFNQKVYLHQDYVVEAGGLDHRMAEQDVVEAQQKEEMGMLNDHSEMFTMINAMEKSHLIAKCYFQSQVRKGEAVMVKFDFFDSDILSNKVVVNLETEEKVLCELPIRAAFEPLLTKKPVGNTIKTIESCEKIVRNCKSMFTELSTMNCPPDFSTDLILVTSSLRVEFYSINNPTIPLVLRVPVNVRTTTCL